MMKCLEQLVMSFINGNIPSITDLLQFAYQCNLSDKTISVVLHTILTHLEKRNTYSGVHTENLGLFLVLSHFLTSTHNLKHSDRLQT